MASTNTGVAKAGGEIHVYEHVCHKMNRISDIKLQLRQATVNAFDERARMLSAPDQCQWMEMMIKLTGSKRGIEVGVFTGYSALCLASGLPEDGLLVACDMEE